MRKVRFALHLLAIVVLVVGVCVGAFARANADDPNRARMLRDRFAAEPACAVHSPVSAPGMPAGTVGFVPVGDADPATIAAFLALLPDTARTRPSRGRIATADAFQLVFGPVGQAGRQRNPVAWVGPDWVVVMTDSEVWRVTNADPDAVAALYARLKAMPPVVLPKPVLPPGVALPTPALPPATGPGG